jgi:hypothetical protein
MFRLWQIYLDNVSPLLKVTHTPTLQSRIIDAASDVATISPALEALIFSIYCVSIVSLTEDDCLALFHSPRMDLLASYQNACQQALRKCGAWRSGDTESLTALYLYLVILLSLSANSLVSDAHNSLPGLGQISDGCSIVVMHACRGNPHRTAYGDAQ